MTQLPSYRAEERSTLRSKNTGDRPAAVHGQPCSPLLASSRAAGQCSSARCPLMTGTQDMGLGPSDLGPKTRCPLASVWSQKICLVELQALRGPEGISRQRPERAPVPPLAQHGPDAALGPAPLPAELRQGRAARVHPPARGSGQGLGPRQQRRQPLCAACVHRERGVGRPSRALLFVVLCPVGAYFPGDALTPVSLLADPLFTRAWVGGVGDCKVGGNYGPTVFVQQEAKKKGCQQVLWLYGPDHQLTEVGTMNIFVFWTHEDGVLELVTPPVDGVILPGVVRQSLLDLAQTWGEFRVVERRVTMKEVMRALAEGRLREIFGSGTACQVCPVHGILYQGEHLHIPTMENGPELVLRFQKELSAIQYGAQAHEWLLPV
ncbi:branched-chain-amino-acid aminotransferase, mitochondrial isoform X3 [Pteropus medius]|uniref:branched-chain-amino-acid aminotransferase, mitochondrial isoform X3 n=1 Tax=Pteropus vampyrus TaxID=132908 RepID=UPI00196B47D3|nr:branched-chain-amino-acid aminotransferase, mitochondrial isoform X3 [Pteropus giganteus]